MKNTDVKNIARQGRAWQSSTSKWSQPDDALRALNDDGRRDFSFHTDKEDNPWWMVDLGRSYPIETIVIGNRRRSHQHLARSLCVEVSDDEWRWTQLHGGFNHWGPTLSINLMGEFSARYIRLSLKEMSYFHLSKVEVFVRSELADLLPRKVSIANRKDGLGERLNAMVNAICLAKAFNLDFKFAWHSALTDDQTHAIETAEEIFSPEFIERYKLDSSPAVLWEPAGTELTAQEVRQKLTKLNGLIGPRLPLSSIFSEGDFEKLDVDLPKAFNSIKFSAKVSAAIDRARSIPLEDNAVGMHLRAGDIFFGDYRKRVHYTYKGLTLPIAKAMLKRLQADGKSVYLFGQDDDVIAYFCKEYGAKSLNAVDSGTENLGRVEKAMYDLVAMSRFPIIASGTSGFAKQAQWIGGSTVLEPKDFFTTQVQHDLIINDLAENSSLYHPMQTAFAYWYAYYYGRHTRQASANISTLEQAAKYDPSNELYPIVLTRFALKANDTEAVGKWFMAAFGDGTDQEKITLGLDVLTGRILKKYNLQEYFPTFVDAAEVHPEAAFIMWALSLHAKRPDEAARYRSAAGNGLDKLFIAALSILAEPS